MSARQTLVAEVAATCREQGLLVPGERVVVAVSAGADSTALAWILAHLHAEAVPLGLVLGHVDHGWRGGEEAALDADRVRELARRLQVEAHIAPPPPAPVASEDAARRWRYQVLCRMAEAHGASKVATGHHLLDQAETVLMRLERGSGRVGLRGIPRRRPLGEHGKIEVVRPLLQIDPVRLRHLLESRGLSWREDPTNQEPTRDRARVRRRLLELDDRGAAATRRLAAFAGRVAARVQRREARLARRLVPRLEHVPWAGAAAAPRRLLASLSAPDLDLALRRLGRAVGADRDGPFFTSRHLDRIRGLLPRGGALDLPRGIRFLATGRQAWLRVPPGATGYPRPILVTEEVPGAAFDLAAFLGATPAHAAALDADRLGRPLTLRPVASRDRFFPWSRGRSRELSVLDFLAKQGVPGWLRRKQLVLEAGGRIAWVAGHRIDRRFAVLPETTRVARVHVDVG